MKRILPLMLFLALGFTRSAHLPTPVAKAAIVDDERRWIHESFQIAQNSVYIAPVGDGSEPYCIDRSYQSIAHRVARDRQALAGARLAHLLNETFR